METLLKKIESLVEPVLQNLGFELIEREFGSEHGRNVLRLYIDRLNPAEGSVTIENCETVSRAVSAVLDVEDVVPSRYVLEVSSPGIDRPLRKEKDFQRFVGEKVELKLKNPIEGRHHFKGLLKGMKEHQIVLEDEKKEWLIPLDLLKRARLMATFK